MKTFRNHLVRTMTVAWIALGLFLLSGANPGHAQTTKWRFIAFGDTRGSGSTDPINTTILTELAAQVVSQQPEFVIVPGDLAYAGSLANFQAWTNLMATVYQAGIGVYPVLGNHDANDPASFVQVFGSFLPDNGPAGEVNRTYAFTCGNVLILGLDTYVNVGRVNQQWIDNALAANTFPHVFAFGHMPAFKANHADCLDDYPSQRDAFWSSLKQAGARVYFCGHDHFYDHMRVDDGDGDSANDVHQLIVGGGGAPLYTTFAYDGVNSIWSPVGVFHENQYGYTVVEVDGLTVTLTAYHRIGANAYAPAGDSWTYTIGGPALPAAPTGLTAQAGDAQVALSWNAVAGATSYNAKRAAGTPSGPYTTVASGLTTTAYTDTGLNNGTTYYYVVSAVNGAGQSPDSAYAGATPQAPAPPSTPVLTATGGRRTVTLTWTASTGATSYTIKRSTTSAGPFGTLKTGLTSTRYSDRKLAGGTTYYYIVTAVNANGEASSNVASATAK
ncbi:MAG TPA: metallophosphoesterase [Verrucomicrobiae bacterium]